MAGPNLLNIPTELLNEICAIFCPDCKAKDRLREPAFLLRTDENDNRKALNALCRTSKRVNAIALPHLYHYLVLEYATRTVNQLLPVVLTTPKLAELTRVLVLEHCSDEATSDATAALVEAAATRFNLVLPDKWREDDDAFHEIISTLLLLHFPNLERLIYTRHLTQWDFLATMDPVPDGFAPFAALKALEVEWYDTESGFGFEELDLLLRFAPSITTFVGRRCNSAGARVSLPSLTNLTLEGAQLSGEDVTTLLESCPRLTSFTYYQIDMYESQPDEPVTPTQLITALSNVHRRNLRSLAIDWGYVERFDDGDGVDEDRIEEMPPFDCLEHLEIDVACFIDPEEDTTDVPLLESLPATLKSLCFTGCHLGTRKGLLRLAARVAGGELPHLKSVMICREGIYREDRTLPTIEMQEELQQAFIKAGVTCPKDKFNHDAIWSRPMIEDGLRTGEEILE